MEQQEETIKILAEINNHFRVTYIFFTLHHTALNLLHISQNLVVIWMVIQITEEYDFWWSFSMGNISFRTDISILVRNVILIALLHKFIKLSEYIESSLGTYLQISSFTSFLPRRFFIYQLFLVSWFLVYVEIDVCFCEVLVNNSVVAVNVLNLLLPLLCYSCRES